ncbi:MAG: PEP-CTERM/exosortase A-associated glycosyltransferase, family [Fibrobacteres bacterium]|nr:PEP-CTERM/exosortase A-associated glycosyltransferase, family [Fibrobacterota bacterium]
MSLDTSEEFPRGMNPASNGHLTLTEENPQKESTRDLVCFSHLRWDFVFQRPQHLLTRFGEKRRVFYVEEPVRIQASEPFTQIFNRGKGVMVLVPHIPQGYSEAQTLQSQRDLVDAAMTRWNIRDFVAWYYTPMALSFTSHLKPAVTVFDCMDELSAFAGAPPVMVEMERSLMARADLVFTGGISLYEAKKRRHPRVYPFPSSIDKSHFMKARGDFADPPDQRQIATPRIGYHGVIDERLNLDLLARCADLKPDWQWILIGPVCKIDPADLPRRRNIHYLGKKEYADLPRYLGKWQAAMMPFAHNASTRYISPTKTPEYLAAGRPVVSTSIKDVEDPYGRAGLVLIADFPADFIKQCEKAIVMDSDRKWQTKVDNFLSQISWDKTWSSMNDLVVSACRDKAKKGGGKHV